MKKIISVFFVLFLLLKVNAQNQIFGVVTNTDNEPLIGANIFLPELNKGTITDKEGRYYINDIPVGTIQLQISFVGYNTFLKSIVINKSKTEINTVLTREIIHAQEIVVSGGYITSQHENAVKIDVLKKDQITLEGTPNFMESITKTPGVEMISMGPGIAKPVIRGLSMNNVLSLNNGVRIENYQYSDHHPLGIDGNDIEKVEIIKGPASLLYGSDAIGGVINFIKSRPAPTGKIEGDYNLTLHSNTLGMENSLGVKGAVKNIFGGVRFGHKTHADYLQGGGTFVPNSRFKEMTINTNLGYSGKVGTFKVFYDYFKQNLGMMPHSHGHHHDEDHDGEEEHEHEHDHDGDHEHEHEHADIHITQRGRNNQIWYQDLDYHILSSINSLYLGQFKWDINVAYQNALRKLFKTDEHPSVEMNLNTITYDTKLHLPYGKKTKYIVGIQGMWQNNKNLNNREDQFLPNATLNNFGVLGLAKYSITKGLNLQGGLRYDFYSTKTKSLGESDSEHYIAAVNKQYSNINGSIGLTYKILDDLIIRTNFAKAYRVPNLSELTSNGLHANRYEMGNIKLSPENSYEGDISLHYHISWLSFDIAGFYNKIQDYIYLSPTTEEIDGNDVFRYSQTNATLYGGETGIHLHPTIIPWLHIEGTFSSVVGKQDNGNYLPFIPAHKFHYEIRAEKDKLWVLIKPHIRVSALSALAQNRPSRDEMATPGYTLLNLGAYFGVKVLNQIVTLGVAANNLLDTKYYDHLSTIKPTYNPGRNISVSLKVPFGN